MSRYVLSYVDAHVAGEPLRLITSSPMLRGSTLVEKRAYMKKHYDFIRSAAMQEPRGHADMYGAVLTEPCHPEADLGIIFIDTALYNNMCGHGSIAIATIAVELGLVKAVEPVTRVVLETGAGLVTVHVDVANGKTGGAKLEGVPSFLYKGDVPVEVFGQNIKVDIVYGGNFFAMVDSSQLGLAHKKENIPEFIRYGKAIREYANKAVEIVHPERPYINTIDDVLFVDKPQFEGDTYKSLCFLGEAMIDRSPCGTGTSARMSALYVRKQLKQGEPFYHESIIGTVFEGMVAGETKVGPYPAIYPTVKGRAFIIGMGNLYLDDEDPLMAGFSIR